MGQLDEAKMTGRSDAVDGAAGAAFAVEHLAAFFGAICGRSEADFADGVLVFETLWG